MKTSEIAELVGGKLRGSGEIEISSCAGIDRAAGGQIAFTESADPPADLHASCILAPGGSATLSHACVILVDHPKLAFARVAAVLHPPKKRQPQIHPTAVIASTATIGGNAFIGAFACVGENSKVGDGSQLLAGVKIGDYVRVGSHCVFHQNVFVEDDCSIGDRVILHAGVVIGADGFGYVRAPSAAPISSPLSPDKEGSAASTPPQTGGELVKFPQIGTVVIEDDVEIGANTCVDRGALGETRIGEGTKIDNLVQVGHNVNIGKRCVIAAQTGISGSVTIEDDCVIGGQVGFGDHVRVQRGAVIGSQAGILPGKIVRPGVWWGTPIQPLDEYKRQNAHVKGLARLKAELKGLKEKIRELTETE